MGNKVMYLSYHIYEYSVDPIPGIIKLGMATHVFKISFCYDENMGNKVMYLS